MQSALQPYATAGVAIVGASLIAVTPVAASLPDIHTLRDVALTSGEAADSSALGDLLAPWIAQYNTGADNATVLANNFAVAPFVGLQQALANQSSFSTDVLHDLSNIPTVVQQMQENVAAVLSSLTLLNASSDTVTATTLHTLSGGLEETPSGILVGHTGLVELLGLLLTSAQKATIEPIINFLSSPLSGIIIGELGPFLSPAVGLINSISDGDSFNETLANMVGAFFNGADLNLDSLIPAIEKADILPLPAGVAINHLDFALGGLLSPGDVANAPYEYFASNGDLVASIPGAGGSIFNSVGLDISALGLHLDFFSSPVGPLSAWQGLSQAIAGLLGGEPWNWSGKNLPPPPAVPPLANFHLPLINPDLFDDGGTGGAAGGAAGDLAGLLGSGDPSDLVSQFADALQGLPSGDAIADVLQGLL